MKILEMNKDVLALRSIGGTSFLYVRNLSGTKGVFYVQEK